MYKTFEYRLYPTREQHRLLLSTLEGPSPEKKLTRRCIIYPRARDREHEMVRAS